MPSAPDPLANGFPPTPGMKAAKKRLLAGYASAERRDAAGRGGPANALAKAAGSLLDAFGGDTPDWLRKEASALADALQAYEKRAKH